ncbi:MAG: 2-amino-4-hydroxy-6-hydroxymethyldihydropteridine diphosphokinase [Beijerinckiaceae bacterium]|nr:2-amino-4-hydroxy-6-hydroxymethyldihydropteridine diphosphokinase [Beijerinckiaceae bacterium]
MTPDATRAYLGLGSNIGDRLSHLKTGIDAIGALPGTSIKAVSPVYETAPWGVTDQPRFLNLCLALETRLGARTLLDAILAIERANGRSRDLRWGPRTLDIDILVFGDEEINEEGLTVPHPHLMDRMFVLTPLCDIAPDLVVRGHRIADALAELALSSAQDGLTNHGRLDAREA